MGGKFSRDKGKRGERAIATLLRNYGFLVRRGWQTAGASVPDVIIEELPLLWNEVQDSAVSVWAKMEQARGDMMHAWRGRTMSEGHAPRAVVWSKKDGEWYATVNAEFMAELLRKKYEHEKGQYAERSDAKED